MRIRLFLEIIFLIQESLAVNVILTRHTFILLFFTLDVVHLYWEYICLNYAQISPNVVFIVKSSK